jgi:CRISPR system Cascade subunit CasD
MATLLLRMKAPMMSWGNGSHFTIRGTQTEPTKSAVIGLLCAALGRPRWESIDDLVSLKMGVRIDREGVILNDFHTISNAVRFGGVKGDTAITTRRFIADADYLVGLEGEQDLLDGLDAALESPCWQLYFGRKSFVPSSPVQIPINGIINCELEEALINYPSQSIEKIRYVLEVDHSLDRRNDVILNWNERRFGSRCVITKYLTTKMPVSTAKPKLLEKRT